MILYLLKDFNDADNITDEQKEIYNMFQRKGMNKVDFLHLMNLATRVEAKKGQVLISDKEKNSRVYFIKEGQLVVRLNGTDVRHLHSNQFAGLMTFTTWMQGQELVDVQKSSVEKRWEQIQHDLFAETIPFIAFVMDTMHLHRDPRHDSEHHAGKMDQNKDDHHQQQASISVKTDGTVTANIASDEDPMIESSVSSNSQVDGNSWYWYFNPLDAAAYLYSLIASSSSSTESDCSTSSSSSIAQSNKCKSKTDVSYIDQHQSHNSTDGLIVHKGYADVICVQDSILYHWSFDSILDLTIKYPSLGTVYHSD